VPAEAGTQAFGCFSGFPLLYRTPTRDSRKRRQRVQEFRVRAVGSTVACLLVRGDCSL